MISACLIVRDEHERLPAALTSVRPHVQEMIVVDTGSTDDTPDIARRMGARVSEFAWCDDFAAARNFALAQASQAWALGLDADERLLPAGARSIARAVHHRPGVDGYIPTLVHTTLEGKVQGHAPTAVRLFRRGAIHYRGRIHEEVRRDDSQPGVWHTLPGGPHIKHVGYDPQRVVARNKIERNLRLLELQLAEAPRDTHTLYLLTRQLVGASRWAEARQYLDRYLLLDPDCARLHTEDERSFMRTAIAELPVMA